MNMCNFELLYPRGRKEIRRFLLAINMVGANAARTIRADHWTEEPHSESVMASESCFIPYFLSFHNNSLPVPRSNLKLGGAIMTSSYCSRNIRQRLSNDKGKNIVSLTRLTITSS